MITIDHKKKEVGLSLLPKRAPRKKLSEVRVGDEMEGKVKSIVSFGAFVDIGCTSDALVHISRIVTSEKLTEITDYIKEGEKIMVRITKLDWETKSIGATMLSQTVEENLTKRMKRGNQIKKMTMTSQYHKRTG